MKSKIILLAFSAILFCKLKAQVNNSTMNGSPLQTPSVVTSHFNTDYPNTVPTWTMDGNNYMATYNDSKTYNPRYAIYDQYGTMISNGERMSSGAYPNGIGDYYTQKYPNESYEVWSSVDGSGNRTFYTDRNSERIWFDKDGKYKNRVKSKTKSSKTTNNTNRDTKK